MANISAQNNIRYTIDTLIDETYGVLYTKSDLDFTKVYAVMGINLVYNQPALSDIHIAFKKNNIWYKLNSSGTFEQISTTTPDINILREKGNTIQELLKIVQWAELLGAQIGLAIGLYTTDKINAIPKIKISFKVQNYNQALTFSEFSPIFDFDEHITINSISFEDNVSSGANVKLYAKATLEDGSNISYTDTGNLNGMNVKSLQFRADYYVPEIGQSAVLEPVSVIYTLNSAITSGITSGEIISITQNWYMNVSQVRMTVQHKPLKNSRLRAYCAFREEPIRVNSEILGNGTGSKITFTLKNVRGLKYDTIKLYYDNVQIYSNFEFNTQSGRVTCEAPEGVLISCSYEYNWNVETWQEMYLSSRYDLDDVEISEFRLTTDAENQSVCAVKLGLEMSEGKVASEKIGTGAGITQTYKLEHTVKNGNIVIYSNGSVLSNKNWYLSEEPQYVRIAAPLGAVLTAKYDWISETPEVYQFAAVFGK